MKKITSQIDILNMIFGMRSTYNPSRGISRSAPRMGSQRLALAGDGGNYPVRVYI